MSITYNKLGNIEFVGKIKVNNSYYTTSQLEAGLNGTGTGSGDNHTYNNISYKPVIYCCADTDDQPQYIIPQLLNLPSNDVTLINPRYRYTLFICDNKPYYIDMNPTSFNNTVVDCSLDQLSNVTYVSASQDHIVAINSGKLYVLNVSSNRVGSSGSMLGNVLTGSISSWTAVSEDTNWISCDGLYHIFVALKGSNGQGTLYVSGYNICCLLGSAGVDTNNNPMFTPNVVGGKDSYLLNTLTPITINENGARITPADWVDYKLGAYFVMARRSNGIIYNWGSVRVGELGNGISYKQDLTDAEAQELGLGYNKSFEVGQWDPQPLSVRVYGSSYSTNSNDYQDVIYDDWIDYSAGWYHAGAIRKNNNNESEVYVWGCNEYGQLGNGNYTLAGLTQSNLTGIDAESVEIYNRPHKLTTSEFPFVDAVKIQATHYGTFITRANGDVYFAGCNKRNQLGVFGLTDGTDTFIPKFTLINLLGDLYCETYGAIQKRLIPQLINNADLLVTDVFNGDLSIDKISDATTFAHRHTVNCADIDTVVLNGKSVIENFPNVLMKSHNHNNISVLNNLADVNGTLYYKNESIQGGGGSSGASITVDPSNKSLDSLTDIGGLNNIAGGYPLEVLSYYNNESYSYIRLAPTNLDITIDRWSDVYYKNGSNYNLTKVTAEILRKGVIAYLTGGTTGTILNSTKDLSTIAVSAKSANKAILFKYLDGTSANNFMDGTIVSNVSITVAQINAGLYVLLGETQTYKLLSEINSVGIGTHEEEYNPYVDIYLNDNNNTLLISGDDLQTTQHYFWDGSTATAVTNSAEISFQLLPVYNNNTGTGVPVISAANITTGLRKKSGSIFVEFKSSDLPEIFSGDLFNDSIYILPSTNDYTGLVNQKYTIYSHQDVVNSQLSKVETVIVKIVGSITSDDISTLYSPGSISDPMMAVVYSSNRGYTSFVSGEYCASVGYNSTVFGNGNNVFGDYSLVAGLNNTVVGMNAMSAGNNNIVVGNGSFVFGGSNKIAGVDSFVYGTQNYNYGYYTYIVGCRNSTFGVNQYVVGFNNELYGNRALTIGSRNKILNNSQNSIVVGHNIECNAKNVFVFGWNGRINEYDGNFPSSDISPTMTATAFVNGGYDITGLHNKNSIHFVMGDGLTANTGEPLDVLTYTKYRWNVNNAYFAATASARSSMEPQLIVPDHRWTFTGKIYMNFSEAVLKANSTTNYDVTIRSGGRVKTCDPGLIINSGSGSINLDFDLGYKFKLKTNSSISLTLLNWVDGAEGYIAIYGGTTISWPATWIWTNTIPTSVSGLASTKFALVKIMVIDSVVIATTIGNF